MILLSILIPVYNAEKYLERCLDSIVRQKEFGNLVNMVIINDGSKDTSLDIINHYVQKYPQAIKIVNRENKGIGPTRNELIGISDGKYIWFVDADDYVDDTSLGIILGTLQSGNFDMLLMGYYWVSGQNIKQILYKGEFHSGYHLAQTGIYHNSLWIRVIKKEVIINHNIRFQPYSMGEDFDFLFKLLPYLKMIKCIESPLYYYVFNPNSAVGGKSIEHKKKVTEDSIKCIEVNCSFISSFDMEKQNILRDVINLFIVGFLYALYIDSFPFEYKKEICRKLTTCRALPMKPLPHKLRQKIFVSLMNMEFSRFLLLKIHTK